VTFTAAALCITFLVDDDLVTAIFGASHAKNNELRYVASFFNLNSNHFFSVDIVIL
jgi:hypothetical protein